MKQTLLLFLALSFSVEIARAQSPCDAGNEAEFLACVSSFTIGLHDDLLLPDPIIDIEIMPLGPVDTVTVNAPMTPLNLHNIDVDIRNYWLILPANTLINAATSFEANGNHGLAVEINGKLFTFSDNGQPGFTRLDLLNISISSGLYNTLAQSIAGLLGIVLPVTLMEYNGKTTASGNELFWRTQDETDNDYFLLERSRDGRVFSELARLDGRGTTNQISQYSWTDTRPAAGTNYYRLSQYDFDGSSAVLGVTLLNWEEGGRVAVGPNPVSAGSPLYVDFTGEGTLGELELISVDGRRQFPLRGNNGQYAVPANLPSGVYVLRFPSASGISNRQIIVR